MHFRSSGIKAMEVFTEVTKLVEAFGLEILYDVMRFSQWGDCKQINISIILMSHDMSQPIIIVACVWEREKKDMPDIVKVWTLKTNTEHFYTQKTHQSGINFEYPKTLKYGEF